MVSANQFLFKVFLRDIKDTEYINITYEDEVFTISSLKKNIQGKLEVFLPALTKVKVNTRNADICVSSIKAETIDIFSDNGDINADIADILEGKIVSQNGDISLKLPENIYKLSLKTNTGDITRKIKSVKDSSRMIKCKSECGDILVLGN